MGVMSAVHWWEEAQMRVLVLGSLVAQFLLLIFSFNRRRALPGWFRFLMWLAYLGGDAIAIYALATLFNRHKNQDRGSKSTLEVMWAPILLIHLGGHDGITAYNIEDNELWSRHLLTAVSQITVAIYVFWRSWRPGSDKRLLQASILLFVPGVLKCFTKPWALKRASINSLVSSPAAKRTSRKGEASEMDPHSLDKYVKQAKAFVQEQKDEDYVAQGKTACEEKGDHCPPQRAKQNEDEMMDSFEDEGEAQRDSAPEEDTKPTAGINEWILCHEAYNLFVDLSSLYRLSIFKYFWVLRQEKAETTTTTKSKEEDKAASPDSSKKEDKANRAYDYVRRGLASAFVLLYTKVRTAGSPHAAHDLGLGSPGRVKFVYWILLWTLRGVLPWAAIGLLYKSRREAYNDTDVKITYAILCCTAVLDYISIVPVMYHAADGNAWTGMVAQYSLIGYFARSKNHGKLMWIARYTGCKDLVDRHWSMESCSSSHRITELVLGYLKDGWRKKIEDVASYRSFIDNRGQWALEGNGNEHLSWSIKEPFDESVLLWHIATEFCFFTSQAFPEHMKVCDFVKVYQWLVDTGPSSQCREELTACRAVQCRQMSNYMVYLLFVNPEMLLPGTRRNIFITAYDELRDIFRKKKLNPQSCCQKVEDKDIMDTLIKIMQDKSKQKQDNGSQEMTKQEGQPNEENFISDAWDLAQGLLKLRDDFGEDKMWKVIQQVWVEMLCFSASRCRGYLHAKALGSGGEFLSYIWLLMFYMGMETFTERLERGMEVVLSCHEGNNSTAHAQRTSDHNGNGTTSSSSGILNRGASSPSDFHTGASTSNSDEIHVVDIH